GGAGWGGGEERENFYERAGAWRDMVQNHVFQLLARRAMEPPISFDADAVRAKKAEVIQAIRPLDPARDAVRGQYDAGTVLGKAVKAYRRQPAVAPDTTTQPSTAPPVSSHTSRCHRGPRFLRPCQEHA